MNAKATDRAMVPVQDDPGEADGTGAAYLILGGGL